MTALSVLPWRCITASAEKNSRSSSSTRLSVTPGSMTVISPLRKALIGSRTWKMRPSPELMPVLMRCSAHSGSTFSMKSRMCPAERPLRALAVLPASMPNRLVKCRSLPTRQYGPRLIALPL